MSENTQDLSSKLAKARQQLRKAQIRVAELEAQLYENQPNLADLPISEVRYQRTLDTMLEGCQIIGFDWRYLYVNDTAARHGLHTKDELLGYTMMERYPGIEKTPMFAVLQRCMQERRAERIANEFTYPDGASAWFELSVQPVPDGIFILSLDITERKQAEEALRKSETRFRSLVEAVEDYAIYLLDTDGHVVSWNTGAERLKGYRSDEIIGQHFSHFFTPEDQQSKRPQQFLDIAKAEGRTEVEGWRVRKDGSRFWANGVITALRNTDDSLYGFAKITRDLTQRKRAEENIRRLHRTLSVLSDINQSIVRIRHLPSLFEKACQIAVEKGTFRIAWIGLFDSNTGRIDSVTHAGISDNDLEKLISTLNTQPFISTLRAKERLLCNDIQNDPMWLSWRGEASRLGCGATAALPLMVAGEIRGRFNLYADETDFFDDQEMRLMDEMAGDIAFAIEVAERDEQRQTAEAAVKRYAQRMEIVHQIDRGIINASSIQEVVQTALKHIRQLIPCQRATLGVIDQTTGERLIFAVDHDGDTALGQGVRVPTPRTWFEGFDTEHTRIIGDIRQLDESNPTYEQFIREGLVSALQVLLMDKDHPIGSLGLLADSPGFFTTEHQEIAVEIANQLAIAIRQLQLSEELARYTALLEQRVDERTAALRVAKERVEAILNNSPDGILLLDTDLSIRQTNASFDHLFGSRPDDYFGQSLVALIHAEDADKVTKSGQAVVAKEQRERIEIRALRKDGTGFDAELSVGLIKDDGLVCVIRDITERKAQERQLRFHASLQESVNDAVITMDLQYHIQSWNRAAERIYGWNAEQVVGKNVLYEVLRAPKETELERQRILQTFHQQGDWHGEIVRLRKDGTAAYILASMTLLTDERGIPFGMVAVHHDITERKRAEEALRQSQQMLSSVIENTPVRLFWKDGNSVYRGGNTLYARANGLTTPDEIIGKTDFDFYPERAAAWEADDQQVMVSGEPKLGVEELVVDKDGSDHWLRSNKVALRNAGGEATGVLVTVEDITERKRAEQALIAKMEEDQEFQNYLKALHEITIELTQINELDTFYKRCVELGLERLGFERLALFLYDADEGAARGTYGTDPQGNLVNESYLSFIPDPNGIMLGALLRSERFYFRDDVPLYKNEQQIGVGWNAATTLWSGNLTVGWLVADNLISQQPASKLLLDILGLYALTIGTLLAQKQAQAALRESEERFRQIAENFDQVLFMRSGDNQQMLYINPRYEQLWGMPRESLYLNPNSFVELVHPDDVDFVLQQLVDKRYIETGFADFEYRIIPQDQRTHWVRVRTFPIKGDDGAIVRRAGIIEDITERKRAEEALRESEERFRLLLGAAPIATVISDQTGHITLVNIQAKTLFGYGRSELIGQTIETLVPAYAHERHVHNRTTYMSMPRVRPMGSGLELFARRKDGSEFPVEIELSYIDTRDGTMVMSFIMDITERKRIAAELEQQRSFLRNVIDVSPSMIFVKDYNARFVLVNPLVATIYNTTVEDIIGKTDADFSPSTQEVINFLEADRHVITSGERLHVEEPITNFAGETRWLQTTKVPIISGDGKSKYVLGISTDITERRRAEDALRESEAKYRSLIETMRGGLVIIDLDNRITYINDRFCELLGYSRDEVMGTRAADYVDATHLPILDTQLKRRRHLESSSYELLFRNKEGRGVYMLVSGSPMIGKNGEYTGSFAVTTDITAQKQAEEILRQALVKEKELGELKSRFVSMASHEFRTPLATILALTETLSAYRHKLPDDQIDGKLDRIKDQIGHLKDIMEDVLLLARMQARRVDFKPVKLDLDALCRSVLDEYRSREDVKHRLDYTCSAGVHELELDRKLMRQIISNLVSNAIKYSPSGKTVAINLEYSESVVTMTVRDEGIGIPEADLQHLFEPFHRAANVGTVSGTGLGLVITKESVELHGGTITVDSQIDIGTTFTVRIPKSTMGENEYDENPGD